MSREVDFYSIFTIMKTSPSPPPPTVHRPYSSPVASPEPVDASLQGTLSLDDKGKGKRSRSSSPTEASQPHRPPPPPAWSGKFLSDLQSQKLIEAVREKNLEMVNSSQNLDPCYSVNGHSPFSVAAEIGDKEIVEALLNNEQFDPAQRPDQRLIILDMLAGVKQTTSDVVETLLNHSKVDPNWKNDKGETALMVALREQNRDSITLLLKQSSVQKNVNDIASGGYTALHFAAMQGDKHFIRELIRLGANENAETDQQKTPSKLAEEHGHAEVFMVAMKSGRVMAQHAQEAAEAANQFSATMEATENFSQFDTKTINRARALLEKEAPENLLKAIQLLKEMPDPPRMRDEFKELMEYLATNASEITENALILFSKALSENPDNRAEVLLEFGNIAIAGDTSESRKERRKITGDRIKGMPNPPRASTECHELIEKLKQRHIDSDETLPDRRTYRAYKLILKRIADHPNTSYANIELEAYNRMMQLQGEQGAST